MKVNVNGNDLWFDVEGPTIRFEGSTVTERPTLILLHGSPGNSDHSVYKPLFSQLADVAQVIYLDMVGCGRSDPTPDRTYSLEGWADDIVGFCEALGINQPIVLGNSAGGMVAAVYGIRHPDHPSKLVLSSTQAVLDVDRCLDQFGRLGGPEARRIAAAALAGEGGDEAWLDFARVCSPLYNPSRPLRVDRCIFRRSTFRDFHGAGGIWHRMDHLTDLADIRCPTLVLAGAHDPITPIADSDDMVAHLDPAITRYERFADAGHSVWLDDEKRAFEVLRRFIET